MPDTGTPPVGRITVQRSPKRIRRERIEGISAERISAILHDLEDGKFEYWGDLSEYMLRQDPHLRSVYDTLTRGVASAELRWHPGVTEGPLAELAERAAEHMRQATDRARRLTDTISHLIHGHCVGVAVAEHDWDRADGAWWSQLQRPVMTRDVRINAEWHATVRTFAESRYQGRRVDTADEPYRWLVHAPRQAGIAPQLSGLLLTCVWPWFLKKEAMVDGAQAIERLAQPFIYGVLPENADEKVVDALIHALENLAAGQSAAVRGETTLQTLDANSTNAGQAHERFTKYQDDQLTKALLGSTLNVDVGSTGGNRALGESQADTTILPRLLGIAQQIQDTLMAQWARPALHFNAHLFGGRMPPLPRPELVLEQDAPPVVDDLIVSVGAVSENEIRQSRGLDEIEGGDRRISPVAKTQPERGSPSPEGAAPFSRAPRKRRKLRSRGHQMSLLPTTSGTSPMSSASAKQIATVPVSSSDDPESASSAPPKS